MTEEDEAFNEIERQAKQRKEAVRAVMLREERMKPYGYVRKDGEGLFIYGEHQFQNPQDHDLVPVYLHPKKWVGLTDEEVKLYWNWEDFQTGAGRSTIFEMVRDIEAKLKEKNT